MSSFKYLCVDSNGKEITGSIAAVDPKDAQHILKDRGLRVVSLNETLSRAGSDRRLKRKKVDDMELYNVSKELTVLLRAGLRIDNCLEIVGGSTSNLTLREHLRGILNDVKAGKSVADAFEKVSVFTSLMVNVIRVGQGIGDLKMAFEHIANHLQFQIKFRSEIKNALTYPIFLILASLVTLGVIFKFIIPRFFSIFGENQEKLLPLAAKILYGASKVFNGYVFIAVVVGVVIFFKFVSTKRLIQTAYAYALNVPLVRSMITDLELSRFSYAMHTMLSSGIEFIKALRYSIDLVENVKIRDSLEPTIKLIKEGREIGEVFSQVEMLPDIVVNMVRVGEKSGNMREIFLELFNIFDDRFKRGIKRIVVLIEPIIITVMGLIVGFIVISLILTVMSVGNIKL
ncbi:MAG: type II secretion system F family protein [Nitrospirae bacterium]|nr:type II secretion system F family protein [Nitrospirota bacterium]